MKFLILMTSLFAFTPAYSIETPEERTINEIAKLDDYRVRVALECQTTGGVRWISATRLAAEKSGLEFQNFKSIDEARAFMQTRSLTYSRHLADTIKTQADKMFAETDWRDDIEFMHEHYNIPKTIDGCNTYIWQASITPGSEKLSLGRKDILGKLDPLDAILSTIATSYTGLTKENHVFSSNKYPDYYGYMMTKWKSETFYGETTLTYGEYEVGNCEWYDQRRPSYCKKVTTYRDWKPFYREYSSYEVDFKGRFDENGKLILTELGWGDPVLHLYDPSAGRFKTQGVGRHYYFPDGRYRKSGEDLQTEKGKSENKPSVEVGGKTKAQVVGLVVSDENGRIVAGDISHTKLVRFNGYLLCEKLAEFYPNGSIKTAFVQNKDQNELDPYCHSNFDFVEFGASGNETSKTKFRGTVKPENPGFVFETFVTGAQPQRLRFSEVLRVSTFLDDGQGGDCTLKQIDKSTVEIPAGCIVVGAVYYKGEKL